MSLETGRVAPELVGAIMDRESGGGLYLRPIGPAGLGDHGFGHGLMQIDSRFHKAWLDLGLWKDPEENVRYAVTHILIPNLDSLGGVPGAVAAYNASWTKVMQVVLEFGQDVEKLDALTTHGDYVSDVLYKVSQFQGYA